jgi:biotin operon repressor
MHFLDQIKLLKRIHNLIKKKAIGSPNQLATRLDISRASVFRQINILKMLGAKINYSYDKESYVYEEEFSLKFS